MRITTRGRYALRAALAMIKLGKDGSPVSIRQLAECEGLSPVFLEQIFYKLRQAGIVSSVRGPGGGFRFSRPLSEINAKELLDAAGEGLELTPCGDDPAGCGKSSDCLAHLIWAEATGRMNAFFASLTFQVIIEKYGALLASNIHADAAAGAEATETAPATGASAAEPVSLTESPIDSGHRR